MLDSRPVVQNTNSEIESKRTAYQKEPFTTLKTCSDEIKTLFGILVKAVLEFQIRNCVERQSSQNS